MSIFSRLSLAVLALTLVAAAPAAAASVQINVPGAPAVTYFYFEGDSDATGEMFVCTGGKAYGGYYEGETDGDYYQGEPCPARTADRVLPPSGGGGGAPCGDMATCQAFLEGLVPEGGGGPAPPCGDMASCQAFFQGLVPGGGGGGPTPPCTDQASCQAFFAGLLGSGPPEPRDCTGAGGGKATCVDFGEGNFLLGDPPDDGAGELGLCIQGAYFFLAGPEPQDGGAGEACPAAAPAPAAGGGTTTPPPSQEPPPSNDGSQQPSESGSTSQPPPRSEPPQQSRPADPPETVRVDVVKRRVAVSRTGRTAVPIECLTARTACRGVLRLTATRRTSTGRRVQVLLARAEFLVQPGRILERKVKLTRAGRRMLAANRQLRTVARTSVGSASGAVVRDERLVLRRR
jgi:hypothetical protein